MNNNPLIIALDVANKKSAFSLVKELRDYVPIFKIGPVLFTRYGPDIIKEIGRLGSRVFLDLKFYDIPNTVGKAVEAIAELGSSLIWGFTLHIAGGEAMLDSAVKAVNLYQGPHPKILGVTVLTSTANASLDNILAMAQAAKKAGIDGVIASPLEIEFIRKAVNKRDFIVATPGIRPEGTAVNDQKRITSPKYAVEKGADYIIIGRPVIESRNPRETVKELLSNIGLPR